MFGSFGSAFSKIRDVRLIALLIIVVAIAMYVAPYLFGMMRCIDEPELLAKATAQPITVRECMTEIHHNARSDTNLAAGVIALAIILAAWRPVPEGIE